MTQGTQARRWLLVMIIAVTLFSIGHHVDHIIRGNHVGWPLIDELTPFSYSFAFYPVIIMGIILTLQRRIGAVFWAVLTAAGFLFVGPTHLGPVASEPPQDIIEAYDSPIAGWLAFGWLLLFLLGLAGLSLYALIMRKRK